MHMIIVDTNAPFTHAMLDRLHSAVVNQLDKEGVLTTVPEVHVVGNIGRSVVSGAFLGASMEDIHLSTRESDTEEVNKGLSEQDILKASR